MRSICATVAQTQRQKSNCQSALDRNSRVHPIRSREYRMHVCMRYSLDLMGCIPEFQSCCSFVSRTLIVVSVGSNQSDRCSDAAHKHKNIEQH